MLLPSISVPFQQLATLLIKNTATHKSNQPNLFLLNILQSFPFNPPTFPFNPPPHIMDNSSDLTYTPVNPPFKGYKGFPSISPSQPTNASASPTKKRARPLSQIVETSSELQPDTIRQKEQSQPSILSSQQIQRGAESGELNESSLGPDLPPPKRRGRPPWGLTEEQWEKYRKSRDEAKAREAALAALPEEVKIQRDLDKTSRALLDHLKPEYGRGRWGVETLLNNGPGLAIQMAPWSPAGS
jgi:hypothetical protein